MRRTIAVLMMVMLVLAACKEKPQPSAQKQQAQKVQPAEGQKKPEEALQAAEGEKAVAEVYTYDPKGRRDPFLSIIEASKREREAEKKKKGLKPSESYDIGEVRVIAIAKDKHRYYAMVQLPDKKYFTIREGMSLGLYGGKVIKISTNIVVVREFIKGLKGEIETRDTILRLRKEEGE
jgi:type IV pilus assembly protein PilP